MKKSFYFLTLLLAFSFTKAQTIHRDYFDGQVYVQFQSWMLKNVSKEHPSHLSLSKINGLKSLISKYGITNASKPFYQADDDAKLPYIVLLQFSKKELVNDIIKDLEKIYGVHYAEKVPIMYTSVVPNDPSYGSQPFLPQINAPNAWNIFNGNSNIRVAIVDNAVMYTHADLIGNTYTNTTEAAGVAGVDDDNNGYIDDINGYDVADNDNNAVPTNTNMNHGTHCAGIAGARTNNGVGISSIGWNLKIIPVKCTANGGGVTSIDNGYGGIVYAAKAGARVISCSWGGTGGGAAGQSVVDYAWNKGSIIIAAAGNANTSTQHYPGAYNNVYCVASVGGTNVKSGFSNFGIVGTPWVDICAPGENILSTLPNNGTGTYGQQSGTSMATPLVAGLAGMILSVAPLMTQTAVLNCISTTAVNIYTIGANATYSTGLRLGAGRIEANAAMTCAQGYLAAPPIANFYSMIRNTCPNTLINFTDSSLYMYTPNNYSWTFQNGTPATSTLSNPSVQWANPGTYSVGLTVSTPNGSNSATKVSYITVSNPIALPLSEGFQANTFLPTNWTSYNIGNDNIYWTRTVNVGGFGTSTACALFNNADYDAGGDRDEMRTPRYNFSNVVSARLRFDVAYKIADLQYLDTLRVKLSTNCGTSWTNIYAKGGQTLATTGGSQYPLWVPLSNQWRRDSVDITALSAGQQNVMMSFVNHGHYGQGIYLDNINIFFPFPSANFNTPPPVCAGNAVTFTNTSTGAGSYTWSFPGGTPGTSTLSNPSITYTAGGVYTASLTAFNGTSTSVMTKTFNINGTPAIAVNNQTICSGGTATITANGAGTYTWSNGFVGNPLIVSPLTNTVYSVSGNSLGCISSNTVSVNIGSQLSLYITPSNSVICSGVTTTLNASGAASYTWNTGANGTQIVVTPTSSSTYSINGTNGLCSGTTVITVTVIPTPAITLSTVPSASICAGQSATLTASGAYTSYTWITPTITANSITVSPNSTTAYTVFGYGNGGCTTSSVVNLTIKPLPVAVINVTPASCDICPDAIAEASVTSGNGPYSYSWSPVGGNQNIVNGFSPGCYTVYITDAGGCTSQQTTCISFVNGISEQSKFAHLIKIYPNPAHKFVMVEFGGQTFDLMLYNNLGQLVAVSESKKDLAMLSLSELPGGVYTIVVANDTGTIRKKLIIE